MDERAKAERRARISAANAALYDLVVAKKPGLPDGNNYLGEWILATSEFLHFFIGVEFGGKSTTIFTGDAPSQHLNEQAQIERAGRISAANTALYGLLSSETPGFPAVGATEEWILATTEFLHYLAELEICGEPPS